ncbi:MAG: AraC family transcriptional regulator [Rhodocyclaceae bacterium]|nr:AraC family transcriptional regulator [Rhodocyclaceae bacterium]
MPRHAPHRIRNKSATVAMGFVTGMLAGMRRRGLDSGPLMAEFGIDLANPATRIPIDRYAQLYNRVIDRLGDEAFALMPEPMRPGSFEFLCRGLLGSAHLAEALERARRFLAIVLPDLALHIERGPELATLVVREAGAPLGPRDDPGRVFAFEWLLRLLHGLACWLVGRGLALERVAFPYARPAHGDDYALVYTERSDFGADALRAELRADLLDLPVRRDEAALARFLEGAPGKISMLYRRDREMVQRVRDLLRAALPESLTIEAAAQRVHLSPRTLHRRLRDEGSSFRAIKDSLRRDIALARLTKTDRAIAEVAAELGYADTSAFYRAFTSWTGVSPDRYRKHLRAGGRLPA